jgi:hypothetical protein
MTGISTKDHLSSRGVDDRLAPLGTPHWAFHDTAQAGPLSLRCDLSVSRGRSLADRESKGVDTSSHYHQNPLKCISIQHIALDFLVISEFRTSFVPMSLCTDRSMYQYVPVPVHTCIIYCRDFRND